MTIPVTTTTEKPDIIDCFSCGRSMVYRAPRADGSSGRCCSDRCREWFDAGNPAYEPLDTRKLYDETWRHAGGPRAGYLPRPMHAGPVGFFIDCVGCGKEFESRGLRCCSPDCERALVARQKNRADMLDAPAAKRSCEECGRPIPRWRNGREVSATVRFCPGGKCARRARERLKRAGQAPGQPNPCFGREFVKVMPDFIGSAMTPAATEDVPQAQEASPAPQAYFERHTPPLNLIGGYRFAGAPEKEALPAAGLGKAALPTTSLEPNGLVPDAAYP
jgi:hypothetical protein